MVSSVDRLRPCARAITALTCCIAELLRRAVGVRSATIGAARERGRPCREGRRALASWAPTTVSELVRRARAGAAPAGGAADRRRGGRARPGACPRWPGWPDLARPGPARRRRHGPAPCCSRSTGARWGRASPTRQPGGPAPDEYWRRRRRRVGAGPGCPRRTRAVVVLTRHEGLDDARGRPAGAARARGRPGGRGGGRRRRCRVHLDEERGRHPSRPGPATPARLLARTLRDRARRRGVHSAAPRRGRRHRGRAPRRAERWAVGLVAALVARPGVAVAVGRRPARRPARRPRRDAPSARRRSARVVRAHCAAGDPLPGPERVHEPGGSGSCPCAHRGRRVRFEEDI